MHISVKMEREVFLGRKFAEANSLTSGSLPKYQKHEVVVLKLFLR